MPHGIPRVGRGPVEDDGPFLRLDAGPDQPVQHVSRAFHVRPGHQPGGAVMEFRRLGLARVPEVGEGLLAFRGLGDQVVHLFRTARFQQPERSGELAAAVRLDEPLVVGRQGNAQGCLHGVPRDDPGIFSRRGRAQAHQGFGTAQAPGDPDVARKGAEPRRLPGGVQNYRAHPVTDRGAGSVRAP